MIGRNNFGIVSFYHAPSNAPATGRVRFAVLPPSACIAVTLSAVVQADSINIGLQPKQTFARDTDRPMQRGASDCSGPSQPLLTILDRPGSSFSCKKIGKSLHLVQNCASEDQKHHQKIPPETMVTTRLSGGIQQKWIITADTRADVLRKVFAIVGF
jgi:hypothetical protein